MGFWFEDVLTVGTRFTVSERLLLLLESPRESVTITYIDSVPVEVKDVVYVPEVAPDTETPLTYHW